MRLGLRRFVRKPAAVAALVIVLVILILGATAPWIATDWDIIDLSQIKRAPSTDHLFGTDSVGRDVLKRTVWGIRTSAEIALGGAAIATVIGVAVGALAGFFGGWRDVLAMRAADFVTAYPAVVITLAAIVYFSPIEPRELMLVFGAFMWTIVARAVRADVVPLREAEFVEAARALGASEMRILLRHVLPNVAGTIVVAGTSLFGLVILVDATVEFFGYGFPAEVAPSLGNLVADTVKFSFGLTQDVASQNYGWWGWFFPGGVLVAMLVCVNLLGDALDEALNPRQHARG